ncbi:glycosyltransferase [Pseudoclavibacter helvolus]|uniref:glycosyltransferase n=1 Tax=Pseudoclavibacter helvolus TaxID=255205 RepID=UPI0024AD47A2|nr:glycosyltransferase [Pseudoclavibacter helvolus]
MTFLYLSGVPLAVDTEGNLGLRSKTASGLQEYRSRMDDEIVVSALTPPVLTPRSSPGLSWQGETRLEGVDLAPLADEELLKSRRVSLAQGIVTLPGIERFVGREFSTVLVDDYSPTIRREITLLTARNQLDRTRIKLGHARETSRIDGIARNADGMQCLGDSSYRHYKRVNSNTVRFSDHRLSGEDVAKARAAKSRSSETLRIAFSGRFIEMKGAHLLPDFATILDSRGIEAQITVLGSGELEQKIAEAQAPNLRMAGFLDFETEWKEYVRDQVDVMFLPHLQSDPSCTYLEAMGSGAPVLGFDNLSLSGFLADGGGGWSVPRGDLEAAADVIARLARDPGELHTQREQGLDYVALQPSAKVFDGRVQHLLETQQRRRHRAQGL